MAKPGFKRVRKGGGQLAAGLLMSGLATAVLGAALWALFFCDACRPRELDADLCPASGPVAYVAVVIDTTDRVGPPAQAEIGKVLDAAIDGMAAGTKLGLYLVEDQTGENPDGASRVAVLCHPGRGGDVNILTESRRDAQDLFEREFLAPVDAALTGMLAAESADTSPIAEALRVAAADLLPYGQTAAPQTVILVSDMVQNSARFSFFRGDRWDALPAAVQEALTIRFEDVEVRLIQILRPDLWEGRRPFEAADVTDFWQGLLAAGRVRRVETLAKVAAE